MKILVVGQFFYPDNFRINDIVSSLVDMGHEVQVVTGLPDYETGYIPEPFRNGKRRRESYNGAEVIRLPIIERRSGAIFRSLNYISFVVSAALHTFLKKEKFDKVFVFQTSPVTMAIPGIVYAKKNRVPMVLYCLDIWPECVKAMNIQEGTIPFRIIHKISKWTYNKANQLLVSSNSFADYLHNVNDVPLTKIIYLPQYTDEEESTTVTHDTSKDGPIRFLFAGNIGFVQDLETIVSAVDRIKDRDGFVVDIVGSGSNLDNIQRSVTQFGLEDKILFHGRKSQNEMDDYYKAADVCLLTLKNTDKIGLTVPGKLQTYMAKGKAIAAAIDGDSVEIIRDSGSGYVVSSGDYIGLSEIMLKYIDDSNLVLENGKNSYQYYKVNFEKNRFFRELISILEG
jgi:glycosyltransferase involved in cell wall biosynthesis